MSDESRIFHESWYRIANQHVSLRSSVKVRRQVFRGERWYVLFDPFSGQFFRLRPPAYEFVARLGMRRTVEEVWDEAMERDPDNAPGQEEAIQLLAQLYHANLLHYELPADSAQLFERYREQKQRVAKATLANVMFLRVPLLDPDSFLKRLLPVVRPLMGPLGAILWIAVVAWGVKTAIDNAAILGVQSQGILALANLPLLYLGLVLIKTLHEFGHAFAVRRFGGEVHSMGIMLLIFSPLPYMDATAAWAFRAKGKRVLVGAAGIIVELFVAACAVLVWANTGEGVLHSLAYNMIFVASVSTILFNINPLLRFDGYYILSDLLDIPNLYTQASGHLRHLVERYAFGYRRSRSPASSPAEAFWLSVFGILSGVYRVVIFGGILLIIADRFLLAGIIMAAVCAVAWVLAPALRLVRYLATDPKLHRTRLRAVGACAAAVAIVAGFLAFCPFPNSFQAPGVVRAQEYLVLVNGVDGSIEELIAPSGARVQRGDALLRLENRELEYQARELEAKLLEVSLVRQRALVENLADLQPLDSTIASVTNRLERLREDQAALVLTADVAGVWVAPLLEQLVGAWIKRGTPVGQLVNDEAFYFSSVVSQRDTGRIFSGEIGAADVRLAGQSERTIGVTRIIQIPMEQTSLPSVALGLRAGGEVAVDATDASGAKAAEPFYELRLELARDSVAALYHGRSGRVRFQLPAEPLLRQWWRRLRQLLQTRYAL